MPALGAHLCRQVALVSLGPCAGEGEAQAESSSECTAGGPLPVIPRRIAGRVPEMPRAETRAVARVEGGPAPISGSNSGLQGHGPQRGPPPSGVGLGQLLCTDIVYFFSDPGMSPSY